MSTLPLGCRWLSFISFLSFFPIEIVHTLLSLVFPFTKKQMKKKKLTSFWYLNFHQGERTENERHNPTRANGLGGHGVNPFLYSRFTSVHYSCSFSTTLVLCLCCCSYSCSYLLLLSLLMFLLILHLFCSSCIPDATQLSSIHGP